MKIIVVSDSHYHRTALSNLVQDIMQRGDINAVIHLGDMVGDAEMLERSLSIPV